MTPVIFHIPAATWGAQCEIRRPNRPQELDT